MNPLDCISPPPRFAEVAPEAGAPYPRCAPAARAGGAWAMVLFVYGTLRRAAGHPMHTVLRENASPLGPARVRGVLVDVGSYPGLVLDAAAGWVHGELYRLRSPAVLVPLDAYEGAGPLDPEPREYRRVRATVLRLDGGEQEAWIYEYARSIDGLRIIASGDFLRPGG